MFDSMNIETAGVSSNLFGEVVGEIGKTIKIQIARNAFLAELSLHAEVVESKSLLQSFNYLLSEAVVLFTLLRASGRLAGCTRESGCSYTRQGWSRHVRLKPDRV